MSPVDDTLDGIILRWHTPQKPVVTQQAKTIRQRLDWLALPIFIVRLCAECLGWVAVLGLITIL